MERSSLIESIFPVIYAERFMSWWSKLNGFEVIGLTLPFVVLINAKDQDHYEEKYGWRTSRDIMRHEYIHIAQQLDFALVLLPIAMLLHINADLSAGWLVFTYLFASCSFFLWYGIDYLINRTVLKLDHYDAYVNIVFEREAYTMDEVDGYLAERPFWGFLYV